MKRLLLAVPFAFFWQGSLLALGLPEMRNVAPSLDFETSGSALYDFRGIVALSNCSGSLVRFEDSQDDDQAMVLTNGHCVGLIDPNKVIVNQRAVRSFDILNAQAKKIGSIRATTLLYATMTKTDLSLYQVKETYQEIEDRYNTQALTLSRETPSVGDAIEILSGYWKRGYSCEVEFVVDTLKEGPWAFTQSLRYSRPGCDTIGGTSGSPVLAGGTRTVVAVNNTGSDAGRRCEMNNPCEVDADGTVTAQKGYSYAQQTVWLYGCRNEQGRLDLSVEGCQLPKP